MQVEKKHKLNDRHHFLLSLYNLKQPVGFIDIYTGTKSVSSPCHSKLNSHVFYSVKCLHVVLQKEYCKDPFSYILVNYDSVMSATILMTLRMLHGFPRFHKIKTEVQKVYMRK